MIQVLKLKQILEGGLVPYRNSFREMKRQKSQTEIMMYFCKVAPSLPASPASPSASAIPETARPNPPHPPQSSQYEDDEDEEFMMIHFHLMIANNHHALQFKNLSIVYVCECLHVKI